MAAETRRVTVRGVPLRWEESGEGTPVVFIHGIPTGPALWRHVIPEIRTARCLAFEMVGYAESIPAGRDRAISVRRQADYLLRLARRTRDRARHLRWSRPGRRCRADRGGPSAAALYGPRPHQLDQL